MAKHIVLLRAVNVGGTGKLLMKDLVALCEDAGFTDVRTYIQSGNVVLESRKGEAGVKAALEKALQKKMGKPVGVLVRSAEQMTAVDANNPFADAPPNRVLVVFVDAPPKPSVLDGVKVPGRERLALRGRELYIHFPDGMGKSKLKVPLADQGTGRNLNTVRKLATMAAASNQA